MNSHRHQEYLERAALREAQKAIVRGHRKEDLGRIKIQTVEPWKRITLALIGVGVITLGVRLFFTDNIALGIGVNFVGVILISVAISGIRRTIESALNGVDILSVIDAMF